MRDRSVVDTLLSISFGGWARECLIKRGHDPGDLIDGPHGRGIRSEVLAQNIATTRSGTAVR